jgi:hypothetical protein
MVILTVVSQGVCRYKKCHFTKCRGASQSILTQVYNTLDFHICQ